MKPPSKLDQIRALREAKLARDAKSARNRRADAAFDKAFKSAAPKRKAGK